MENMQINKKVTIVIPTFNERDNIVRLLPLLSKVIRASIIIVDDDSQDGTAEAVKSLNSPNIQIIIRKNEKGLGSAIRTGILKAIESSADYIVTMDADLSHDPVYLPSMYEKAREGYDLIIGSRYVKGGGIENWPLKRRVISWGANFLVRLLLRSPLHDNTSNYRVYSTRAAKEALKCESADGYEFQICAVYRVLRANFPVAEVPIVFKDREIGKSKLTSRQIYKWFKYVIHLTKS
ncbi:polyprenol monophosphomannose synthase [Acidianus sp. HS-5]|uniref:polyprenol monophosphomannose synthase n=1 Tax=Acidianus sp. HS-5 TaxID=2886040 RepID=UPI001F455074|nr:polyprenol monophosphomannose synthase [Acidianus sp. HS-5]BDC19566.1 dolichol-phosphate mannosyltransferase [Acidianus sp. HS-5]